MKSFQTLNNMGYLPEGDIHGRYVWKGIREGIWPFRPRTINLYLEFDIDFNRYVLFVEIWFPDYQIRSRVDINAFDLADDPLREAIKAGEQFKNKIRDREDFMLAPLIYLGDN